MHVYSGVQLVFNFAINYYNHTGNLTCGYTSKYKLFLYHSIPFNFSYHKNEPCKVVLEAVYLFYFEGNESL